MALATSPVIASLRPACKRHVEKATVIMEDTRPATCMYHKNCLTILMNIYEKNSIMANDVYDSKISKIAEMVTSDTESDNIFQTFCGISFLDRYRNSKTIASATGILDRRVSKPAWRMMEKLQYKCVQLLTRMSMIENLSSLDADLVCLLCMLCKSSEKGSPLFDLLLEIGRSVWPYLKRPLWHSEPFVEFVADIFEVVGCRLEQLYPKNFCVAWEVIRTKLVTNTEISSYSRLRLLAIVEHRQRNWSMPVEVVEFYRQQYTEFTDARKKEIMGFLGLLSSRHKTSLSAKPGRSAADFLKRRQSQESQEADKECFISSGEGTKPLPDMFEEVFENENVCLPNSSTDCFKTGLESRENFVVNRKTAKDFIDNVKQNRAQDKQSVHAVERRESIDRNAVATARKSSVEQTKVVENDVHETYFQIQRNLHVDQLHMRDYMERKVALKSRKRSTEDVKMHTTREFSSQTEENVHVHEQKECVNNGETVIEYIETSFEDNKTDIVMEDSCQTEQNAFTVDKGVKKEIEKVNEQKEDEREIKNEDVEEEDLSDYSGWDETGNIWQESDSGWQENSALLEGLQAITSPRDDDSTSDETTKINAERRFVFERKKEIIKVPKKYVGRVIGTQGSVITAIQNESGASVHIVRQQKEKVAPTRPAFSMSTAKNIVHNTLGIPLDKTDNDDWKENENGEDKEDKEIDEQEEFEFEMCGTEKNIEKAKWKIEGIISHAKSLESNANLKRSKSDGDEANFSNFGGYRRSFYPERKRVVIKVNKKYVGRVIGTSGSMIMTIEQETGAKVTFVKDKRTEKYKERNMERLKREAEMENERNKVAVLENDVQGKETEEIKEDAQNESRCDTEIKREVEENIESKIQTESPKDTERERNIEQTEKHEGVQNETPKDGEQGSNSEQEKEIISSEDISEVRLGDFLTRIRKQQEGQIAAESRCEDKNGEAGNDLPEKVNESATSSEESSVEGLTTNVEETENDEYDFELFGTEDAIEKAKKKIEFIKELVDNQIEKKQFRRSQSFSFPIRGFKQFKRSLSCPISDWGESCAGDCASCEKGFYCRSFLLLQSESPSCWVRPEALSLTQEADWAEFIVKTKVDDQALWRPRKPSDVSIKSSSSKGSTEDISREETADQNTDDVTTCSAAPAEDIVSGDLADTPCNTITERTVGQVNGNISNSSVPEFK